MNATLHQPSKAQLKASRLAQTLAGFQALQALQQMLSIQGLTDSEKDEVAELLNFAWWQDGEETVSRAVGAAIRGASRNSPSVVLQLRLDPETVREASRLGAMDGLSFDAYLVKQIEQNFAQLEAAV